MLDPYTAHRIAHTARRRRRRLLLLRLRSLPRRAARAVSAARRTRARVRPLLPCPCGSVHRADLGRWSLTCPLLGPIDGRDLPYPSPEQKVRMR